MEKRSVQVNCRMSADSADRLKALAESSGLPLGAFIEKILDCYHGDSKVIADSDGWQSVADDLSNRVLALESRLEALEVVGAVRTGAVGIEADNAACEPVDVVPDSVDAGPGMDQCAAVKSNVVINHDVEAFKTAVIEHHKRGNLKPSEIAELVFKAGYQTKIGTMRDSSYVGKVIKAAELKG